MGGVLRDLVPQGIRQRGLADDQSSPSRTALGQRVGTGLQIGLGLVRGNHGSSENREPGAPTPGEPGSFRAGPPGVETTFVVEVEDQSISMISSRLYVVTISYPSSVT